MIVRWISGCHFFQPRSSECWGCGNATCRNSSFNGNGRVWCNFRRFDRQRERDFSMAPLVSFQDATLQSGWLSRIILQLWGNRTLFNMNAPIWQAFIGLLNSPKSKSWSIGGIGHGAGCYSIVLNCKYEFNGICNAGPEHHRSANWSKSWFLPIYCEDMAAPQQAGSSDIPFLLHLYQLMSIYRHVCSCFYPIEFTFMPIFSSHHPLLNQKSNVLKKQEQHPLTLTLKSSNVRKPPNMDFPFKSHHLFILNRSWNHHRFSWNPAKSQFNILNICHINI